MTKELYVFHWYEPYNEQGDIAFFLGKPDFYQVKEALEKSDQYVFGNANVDRHVENLIATGFTEMYDKQFMIDKKSIEDGQG